METTISENDKTLSAFIHISTFLKYVFPANFIVPIILWTTNKEKPFVDNHGKRAINFQLSVFLYSLVIALAGIALFAVFALDFFELVEIIDDRVHHVTHDNLNNVAGYFIIFGIFLLLLFGLFVLELYAVISATIHAANGKLYKYPLCIPFLQSSINNQKQQ